MNNDMMRRIPRVDTIISLDRLSQIRSETGSAVMRNAVRECIDEIRRDIIEEKISEIPSDNEICAMVVRRIKGGRPRSLRRVVNATGVVIHTNLGRAPLGDILSEGLIDAVSGYCNLEYDIEEGHRSQRNLHVEELICRVTGAEAAVVVNNNASAVFLALNSIASGRRTAVSRGELVEIGGSFRVPDIMASSGAQLVEIGTTNKTKPSDYIMAVEEKGAEVLLKVHTSNFRIEGFSQTTDIEELSEVGRKYGCPVIYDLGAAFVTDREMAGMHEGGSVRKSLEEGADIVMFSGDKLMGSVQAGIIAGKKEYIDLMRNNSFMRMLRPDKLQLAVLEETLSRYLDPEEAAETVPVMKMFRAGAEQLMVEAASLKEELVSVTDGQFSFEAVYCEDVAGGGSLPGVTMKGAAVAVDSAYISVSGIERLLRKSDTPVVSRIAEGRLLLSVRTLCPGDRQRLIRAFEELNTIVKGE